MNYDSFAPRVSRRAFRVLLPFSLLLFLSVLPWMAAQAHTESITIPCSGPIEMPEGGLRAASDGDTWEFSIVPGAHTEIYDQHWFFNGLSPSTPNLAVEWGELLGGLDGSNSLSWLSPTQGGTYSITVKAKRRCTLPGGGGDGVAVDPNFEIDWGVDVKAKKTWDVGTALTATMASPTDGLKAMPGVPVTCNVTASDSDHWKKGDEPGAEEGTEDDTLTYEWSASGGFISGNGASVSWMPPNATGTYTITCIVNDPDPQNISPIDDGTRDDAPVTVNVSIEVPPRTWSAGASIGQVLDSKGHPVMQGGVALENGRLVAPSNQTVPKPPGQDDYPTIIVRPGKELSCTVEEAKDFDHWKREGVGDETDANYGTVHGDAEDEVNYTWSAGAGTFKNGHTGTSVTWVAPKVGDDGFDINQEYTITCTLDDKPATVSAPDVPVGDTARNDAVVTRPFKVKVVDDTSWMELSLHRDNNGTPIEDSATGTIGGKMWIAVDVQVGGLSKISSPSGTVYLRVTEHDGLGLHGDDEAHGHDEHAWLAVPLGGTGWKTWNFDTENGGANPHWNADNVALETENTTNSPKRYRYLIRWQTTDVIDTSTFDPDDAGPLLPGKLLGHNASHTVELEYSVPHTDGEGHTTYEIKHEMEFQSKGEDGNYEAARKSGPNLVGAEVKNLVITEAKASDGNLDYIRYDTDSDDPDVNNPSLTFKFEDADTRAGDTYEWQVLFLETQGTKAYLQPQQPKVEAMPTTVPVTLPQMPAGVYGFDIIINKKRNGAVIDSQILRSEDASFESDELDVDENDHLKFQYHITSGVPNTLPLLKLDVTALNSDWSYGESVQGPMTLNPAPAAPHIIDAPNQTNNEAGEGRIIATGEDDEARRHRDHKTHRLMPMNSVLPNYQIMMLNGPDFPGGPLNYLGGGLKYGWASTTKDGFATHLPGSKHTLAFVNSFNLDAGQTPEVIWAKIHSLAAAKYKKTGRNVYYVQADGHGNPGAQDISTTLGSDDHGAAWVVPAHNGVSNTMTNNDYALQGAPEITGVSNFHAMGCGTSGSSGTIRQGQVKYHYRAIDTDYAAYIAKSKKAKNSVGYTSECTPELGNGRNAAQLWYNCFYKIGLSGAINPSTDSPINSTAFSSLYTARQKYKVEINAWSEEDFSDDPEHADYGYGNYDDWVITFPDHPLIDEN